MKVIIKPVSGIDRANIERVKDEMIRVLAFRGNVIRAKATGSNIVVSFNINPQWDMAPEEKVNYLKEWIPAKTKSVFSVLSVSER
jgi:hypothetical protein